MPTPLPVVPNVDYELVLDCVHCGLCLNACPTYRELGVEMDSPRGRIYQMVQVANGSAPMDEGYLEHMGLCLGCRACETACPSGVEYGKLIEGAEQLSLGISISTSATGRRVEPTRRFKSRAC